MAFQYWLGWAGLLSRHRAFTQISTSDAELCVSQLHMIELTKVQASEDMAL